MLATEASSMVARIKAVQLARSRTDLLRKGSIKLAVQAAARCLKETKIIASDVDIIINTGIYRDGNIGEPAIASLIQERLKANPAVRLDGGSGTFSFDLSNAGCGLLTGIQVVGGLLDSKTINVGMVVTSDVDPNPRTTEGYRFEPAGAAILLERGDNEGFVAYHMETFSQYVDMFESRIVFVGERGKGRNILRLSEKEGYTDYCVDCAQEAMERFFVETGTNLNESILVIPSQSPIRFPEKFRVRMDLQPEQIVDVSEKYGALHTTGPAAALDYAIMDGRFNRAKNVFFVTVGSGITVALGLYQKKSFS
jgi:3-oxoacyl-[acyl-carrier-protein] synthase-3